MKTTVMRVALGAMLLAVGACRAASLGGGSDGGAPASNLAVSQFLAAAQAQDLQAMSAVWGDEQRLARDGLSRDEAEKRLLIMLRCLRHESANVGPSQPAERGRLTHDVRLTNGPQQVTVRFTAAKNTRSGRWYVADFDMAAAQPLCNPTPASR